MYSIIAQVHMEHVMKHLSEMNSPVNFSVLHSKL